MSDYAGKVAVITGGASGIGKAMAELMTERGAAVVIVDFSEDNGRQVSQQLGASASFVPVNIADASAVKNAFQTIARQHPRIDVLVNCAGISTTQMPVADYPVDDWHNAININLNGTFYAMKYAIPLMLNRDAATGDAAGSGAAIVNLSSIMGQVANPNGAAYAAGKHGVIGLTKAAAQDYGKQGIRVNAIGPGVIETPMTEAAMSDKAVIAAMQMATPLGRFGQAREVAQLIAFLCSDRSGFITGAYYPIDGGFLTH